MVVNALGYASSAELLPGNPLGQIHWKAAEIAETFDRHVVDETGQLGLPRSEAEENSRSSSALIGRSPRDARTARLNSQRITRQTNLSGI